MKSEVKLNFENIIFALLFLFILIASGGAYPQVGIVDVFYVLIFTMCLACAFFTSNTIIPRAPFISVIMLFLSFAVLLIIREEGLTNVNQNKVMMKMGMLIPIIVALSGRSYRKNMQVLIALFNILLVVSLAGLALAYIDVTAYKVMTFVGKYSSVTNTYFYIEDVTVREFYGIAFIKSADVVKGYFRNQGIFWEPGAFSFFICLFYVMKNCYLQDKKWNYLYVVVELTTISAAGIIIFVYMFMYVHFLHGRKIQSLQEYAVLTLAIFFAAIFLVFSDNILDALLQVWGAAFGRDFANEASAVSRWRDFHYGLMAAMEEPLWGHGWNFDNYNAILRVETNSMKLLEWGGISNAIVAIFYRQGIFFLIYYLLLLWRLADRVTLSGLWTPIVFIGFSIMLMHEPLEFSVIVMFFLCCPPPAQAKTAH